MPAPARPLSPSAEELRNSTQVSGEGPGGGLTPRVYSRSSRPSTMRTRDSWGPGLGQGHRQEQQQPGQDEDGQAGVGGMLGMLGSERLVTVSETEHWGHPL